MDQTTIRAYGCDKIGRSRIAHSGSDTIDDVQIIGWWPRYRPLGGQFSGWMAFLAMMIGGFGYGFHQLALAWRESAPTEMSCADYVAKRPGVRWLRLTGCEAVWIAPLETQTERPSPRDDGQKIVTHSEISALVIGMRPAGGDGPLPIFVVLDDSAALRIAHAPSPFHRSEWPPMKAALEHGIEGMVGDKLPDLFPSLAKGNLAPTADPIRIDADRHPLIGFSIAMLVVGVVGLLGVLLLGWPLIGKVRRIQQSYREKRDFPGAVVVPPRKA